jgi:steroid delta-isomerase-like uncharacterized protein
MLTAQDNATLVRAHYDTFNLRNWDKCLAMASDSVRWTTIPFDMTFDGRKGYRQCLENWTTAMPDVKVEIVNLIAGEEWIAAECIARGTHTGPLVGPNGTIDPTQKKVEMKFCDLFRVVDGQITEGRTYFDGTTMMRQLGILPAIQSPNAVPARN